MPIDRDELKEALYGAVDSEKKYSLFIDAKRTPTDKEVATFARRVTMFLDGLPDPLDITEVVTMLREEYGEK